MRWSLRTFFVVFTVLCVALFFVSRWYAPRDRSSYHKGVGVVLYDPLPEHEQIRAAAERSLHVEGYTVGKSRFRATVCNEYGQRYGYKIPDAFGDYGVKERSDRCDDPSAYLIDSGGQGIDVLVRVPDPGEHWEVKGGKRCKTIQVWFTAHVNQLRFPYSEPTAGIKVDAVIQEMVKNFRAECEREHMLVE